MHYVSVSQHVGPDPLLGPRHLLLGCQNLCFSTMNEINGSPNCVIFCFVGSQLLNVENHCTTLNVRSKFVRRQETGI